MAPIIGNRYTTTVMQRALTYVEALDQGKTSIEAYQIAHPQAKRNTAISHTYQYKLTPQVSEAIQIFYKHKLPAWCRDKAGRASMLSTITDKTINDPETLDIARKSIVDIDKILDPTPDRPQGPSVVIDMRSIIINDKQAKSLSNTKLQDHTITTDLTPTPPEGEGLEQDGSHVA